MNAPISPANISKTFPWPLGRRLFCGQFLIGVKWGQSNGSVTKKTVTAVRYAAITFLEVPSAAIYVKRSLILIDQGNMKANIQIDIRESTPSNAQRIILDVCERLKSEGFLTEYHFEIDTPDGVVTEKCVLDSEKVIA